MARLRTFTSTIATSQLLELEVLNKGITCIDLGATAEKKGACYLQVYID